MDLSSVQLSSDSVLNMPSTPLRVAGGLDRKGAEGEKRGGVGVFD